MDEPRRREEREAQWRKLEDLLARAEKSSASLSDDEIIALPVLYREALSSLSVARAISLDQSLMSWYTKGVISYDQAVFNATNPSEFALRVQGVAAASDTSWDRLQETKEAS